MDFDLGVKLAIYRTFAATGQAPDTAALAADAGATPEDVREAYRRLRIQRVLFLEPDRETIRMAPPFSAVATQHRVVANGVSYFANCAWDALGIPAALRAPAVVESRCEQTREPLRLEMGVSGPQPSDWLFHCQVPASRWWDDLVFT
jgi:hypothetical protein